MRGTFAIDPDTRLSAARASGPFRIVPAAVATPAGPGDLTALVHWARGEGRVLVPRGAATGMPGGNVGSGVAVELRTGFRWIGEIDAEGAVRVGAGAVAAEVDRKARDRGFFLPALPSSADRCTLGGMAANNAAGPRSFGYGSIRDWIRALEVVLADGRRVRLRRGEEGPAPFPALRRELSPRWPGLSAVWPRVRKNSSGYALDRFLPGGDPVDLLVGSEGTLGLITELELVLAPEPSRRGLAVVAVDGPEGLTAVIRVAEDVEASACEFFGRRFLELARLDGHPRASELARGSWALLLVELEGDEVEGKLDRIEGAAARLGVAVHQARSPGELRSLWEIRHAASPTIAAAADRGLVSTQFIEDSVVPPERLPDYLHGLSGILSEAGIDAVVFGHAGDGNVHVNPLIDVRRPGWKDRVRAVLESTAGLVSELGGTLSGEHGDGRLRAPLLSRIWPPEAVEAFERVKDTLDPGGSLNPGVILPLEGQDPLEFLLADPGEVPHIGE